MLQALTTQAPAVYLAVTAGLALVIALQWLTASVKTGTIRSLEKSVNEAEARLDNRETEIRALGERIKTERERAGASILAITKAAIVAVKTSEQLAREFVKDRTDKAIAAIVRAEQQLEALENERDDALDVRDEALAALDAVRGTSNADAQSDAEAQADFAETSPVEQTATERPTLDEVLFGGTPFKASGPGSLDQPIQATFKLGDNGEAVPTNGPAKFLVSKLGAKFFNTLGRKAAAEEPFSVDDLKAALAREHSRPNGDARH